MMPVQYIQIRAAVLMSLMNFVALGGWAGQGMLTGLDDYDVTETILTIWDAFGHDPKVDLQKEVGVVLYASEVEAFGEWIEAMDGARGLYALGSVLQATLTSEGGRRFFAACSKCLWAMIENGIPGLKGDNAAIIAGNRTRQESIVAASES